MHSPPLLSPGRYQPGAIESDDSRAPDRTACRKALRYLLAAAFNNSYKVEPEVFGLWMRILKQTPGSVLWLSPAAAPIEKILRSEAAARGVAGERLVFARKIPAKADHLTRHRLADLYLDSLIYNGHTTAADALWSGLPLLTCPGQTFASRVGASLLTAAGLPNLIVPSETEYERLAVRLGNDPATLREIKATLSASRPPRPFFDTPRFVRGLERAYLAMREIHAEGRKPERIVVDGD